MRPRVGASVAGVVRAVTMRTAEAPPLAARHFFSPAAALAEQPPVSIKEPRMNEPLSRRHLLASATAAGVALAAGVGRLRAAAAEAPATPADRPAIRWGIIGAGARGVGTHIPVIEAAPGAKLVALCDVSEDRLKAAAA